MQTTILKTVLLFALFFGITSMGIARTMDKKDMESAKQKQQLVYCNTSEVLMQIWLNLKPVLIK